MFNKSTFAQRLRVLRARAGINQSQAAAKLGVSPSSYNDWENEKSTPTANVLPMLASLLGCTTDFLLGVTDHESPLQSGHWVIDQECVEMIRREEAPPGRRFAWQIPARHQVLDPVAFSSFQYDLLHPKKEGTGDD